ncbi:MAG: site-specific DNA-methyltransferase [Candidatus Zixiibacteriota bacterium]|nr:MAG: site-specific DNA-methyltransferase [candidate division Zixibacteria bacterium]
MSFPPDLLDRLICGDNRDLFARLPDACVDLVLTDPPYKDYRSNRPVAHPKLKQVQRRHFDREAFARESFRVLKEGAHLYCFCDHLTFPEIRAELVRAGFLYKNCLVWIKNNHGSGDLRGNFAPQHEFIIFAAKGRSRPLQGKRQSNVLVKDRRGGRLEVYPKVNNYRYNHGTSKPVDLLRRLIQASSDPGEIVLDPYGGSGSTAEAARREGRRYMVWEIDPDHHREAEERLKIYSPQRRKERKEDGY